MRHNRTGWGIAVWGGVKSKCEKLRKIAIPPREVGGQLCCGPPPTRHGVMECVGQG